MRLRRALGYAALGLGAAAVTNGLLERQAARLQPALSGRQRSFRWRGMTVAYTERGDRADPTIVLVHAPDIAASGSEWRDVVGALDDEYHVVVPDLPGFGRSERPPLRYSAALYEDFLADFLPEFAPEGGPGTDGEPADTLTVVASGLAGAHVVAGGGDAVVDRLVLVCPVDGAGPSPARPWVREILRVPVLGEAVFNGLASRPVLRRAEATPVTPDATPDDPSAAERLEYAWQSAHQPNARFAPAALLGGFLDSEVGLGEGLAALDAPTTLVWGREARRPPLDLGRDLAEVADCGLVVFEDAGAFPHVEWPGEFAGVVRRAAAGGPGVSGTAAEAAEGTGAGDTDGVAEGGVDPFEDADVVAVESSGGDDGAGDGT